MEKSISHGRLTMEVYVHANKIHILPNTYFIVFNKRAYVKCNDLEKNKYFNEMREITI